MPTTPIILTWMILVLTALWYDVIKDIVEKLKKKPGNINREGLMEEITIEEHEEN